MIALGGDSGTGKTTLSAGIELIFGAERIRSISLDDYHALDRAQRAAVGLGALDPRTNNFAAMEEDLWALREGRAVDKPVYDHATGTFAPNERIEPREFVIVRGLFPLYTRALRSLFDVTVWFDPEPALKAAWKIQRDTLERGYTRAQVIAGLERRREGETYLAAQARFADLNLAFHGSSEGVAPYDPAKLSARIRKGGRFRPLDYAEFESSSTSIRQLRQTAGGGYPETVIELDGHIDPGVALAVEERIWSHTDARGRPLPAHLGEFKDEHGITKTSYTLGLAQLLIARRVVLIENELREMVSF